MIEKLGQQVHPAPGGQGWSRQVPPPHPTPAAPPSPSSFQPFSPFCNRSHVAARDAKRFPPAPGGAPGRRRVERVCVCGGGGVGLGSGCRRCAGRSGRFRGRCVRTTRSGSWCTSSRTSSASARSPAARTTRSPTHLAAPLPFSLNENFLHREKRCVHFWLACSLSHALSAPKGPAGVAGQGGSVCPRGRAVALRVSFP